MTTIASSKQATARIRVGTLVRTKHDAFVPSRVDRVTEIVHSCRGGHDRILCYLKNGGMFGKDELTVVE